MERFETFYSLFFEEAKHIKSNPLHTDLYCRDEWHIDLGRMLRTKSIPNIKTYFRFCIATGKCPVEFMIVLLKGFLDPAKLILFIRKTFNYNEPC